MWHIFSIITGLFASLTTNFSKDTNEAIQITQETVEIIEIDVSEIDALETDILEFDFYSDSSYQKFLDDDYGFENPRYVPDDLVPIDSSFTSNDSSKFKLRKEAGIAFADMAWHFQDFFDSKKKLHIVSTYRSYDYQKWIAKNCAKTACARAGHSEHQAWLALDLWVNWWWMKSMQWDAYQRLKDNAHLWGFHNTYQKWVSVDLKIVEPWHWRYVWVELATELKKSDKTLREFVINSL